MARRSRRRRSRLEALGDVLDAAYPGRPEDRPLIQTFGWWDRTVPQRIAQNARPVHLKRGMLVIHTRSSAWAQELSFHEEDLLRSIRERVPQVTRVRIRVGPMPPPPPPPLPPPPKTTPLAPSGLPGEVARALAHLGDDRLRSAVTRAACMSLAPAPELPRAKERRNKMRGARVDLE